MWTSLWFGSSLCWCIVRQWTSLCFGSHSVGVLSGNGPHFVLGTHSVGVLSGNGPHFTPPVNTLTTIHTSSLFTNTLSLVHQSQPQPHPFTLTHALYLLLEFNSICRPIHMLTEGTLSTNTKYQISNNAGYIHLQY